MARITAASLPAPKSTAAARSAAGTGLLLPGAASRAPTALSSVASSVARFAAGAASALALCGAALAGDAGTAPKLYTNQQYVEDVTAPSRLDVANMSSVLRFVLASLPDEVTVYPTENYFYFSFYDAGVRWAGNLRLDVETRDAGNIHMTYFKDFTTWQQDEKDYTKIFGAADGVKVEKLRDLVYRVSFGDRSVVFRLNDVSAVVPPAGVLLPGERYLGPVFDESGIRFFLVFKPEEKLFLFVLDETITPADELYTSSVSDKLTVGRRTGFAFYVDREAPRRILVGVQAGNTGTNNYLDGPFDQLPDNFIKGNDLLEAILAVSPELAGTLDRFGNSADDTVRYLIAPYMQYEYEDELAAFVGCISAAAAAHYWDCYAPGMGSDGEAAGRWDEETPGPDGSADGEAGGG